MPGGAAAGVNHTLFAHKVQGLLSCGLGRNDEFWGVLGHGEEMETVAVPTP